MVAIDPVIRTQIYKKLALALDQRWAGFHNSLRLSRPGENSLHITSGISALPFAELLLKDMNVVILNTNSTASDYGSQAFEAALAEFNISKDLYRDSLKTINLINPYQLPDFLTDKYKAGHFQHIAIIDLFKSVNTMNTVGIEAFPDFARLLIENIMRYVRVGGTVFLSEDASSNFNFVQIACQKPYSGKGLIPAACKLISLSGEQGDVALLGVVSEEKWPTHRWDPLKQVWNFETDPFPSR